MSRIRRSHDRRNDPNVFCFCTVGDLWRSLQCVTFGMHRTSNDFDVFKAIIVFTLCSIGFNGIAGRRPPISSISDTSVTYEIQRFSPVCVR
jgi:hypothetical protein